MSLETIEIDVIMREAIKQQIALVMTGCPAYVVAMADGQYVDVQPVIRGRRLDADEDLVTFLPPQIQNVPLLWAQAGNLAQTFPVKTANDDGVDNATWVWLAFGDRSMDEWLNYGEKDVTPASQRRHSISDAVAIAGLRPKPIKLDSVPNDRVRLGQYGTNPTRIEVTETGGGGSSTGYIRIGNDNAELLTLIDDALALIEDAGCITALGDQPLQADILGTPTPIKPLIAAIRLLLDQIRQP